MKSREDDAEVNRWQRKRQHKHEMKKSHANHNGYFNQREYEQRMKEEYERDKDRFGCLWRRWLDPRNDGYKYWRRWYLSGNRKIARRSTERKIRQVFREMLHRMDPEDVRGDSNSDYRKRHDFWWEIW